MLNKCEILKLYSNKYFGYFVLGKYKIKSVKIISWMLKQAADKVVNIFSFLNCLLLGSIKDVKLFNLLIIIYDNIINSMIR